MADLVQPLHAAVAVAVVLLATLPFWLVWHADGTRRSAGIVWLAGCLLATGLLHAVRAPTASAGLLLALGQIGAVLVPPGAGRARRVALSGAPLALAAALAWYRTAPPGAVLQALLVAALLLAAWRAWRLRTASAAWFVLGAASALVGRYVEPSGDDDVARLLPGRLCELVSMYAMYRVVLQQTLRHSLLRLGEVSDALQAVASPLLLADADGRIRWVNAAWSRATGYSAEQLVGQPTTLFEFRDEASRYAGLHAALKAGAAWSGQLPVRRHDGTAYVDERRSTPVLNEMGVLTGHVWVGDDITERQRAQDRLRHSEESLRRLVDSAPDAIIVSDAAGRIQRANPRVQDLLGYAPDELVGRNLKTLMPPLAASRHDHYMQGHARGRRSMTSSGREVQAMRKDGRLVAVHVKVGEMPYHDGRSFVGFLRDMTEHKRAEAALHHSEERLRKLYDMSPLGIALTDMEGRFLDFNRAFAELSGYDEAALKALSYWDLTPMKYEADERRHLEQLRRGGRYGPYEKEYRCRDGHLRPVRLNGVRIELDGRPCIWSIVEDLTAQREAELEHDRLQRQLMQSQKMEALGQLTGGIAHDFNNMLTGILGLSTLALERHVADPQGKVATYLREITRVGERGRDLIGRLMRFARPAAAPQAPQPIALRPVVEEVLRMLESALPSQLKVTLQADDNLPDVRFAEVDLHQVLTNLVINARDAMGGQGEVSIELSGAHTAGVECSSCGRRVGGPHVVLRVRDGGAGIPPELRSRIFDPFFTTKDVGKGTGLGLAMVHSLVHQAGGHIAIDSVAGRGTTFELLLPPAVPSAPPAALPDPPTSRCRTHATHDAVDPAGPDR